jgi:hypothetical protein
MVTVETISGGNLAENTKNGSGQANASMGPYVFETVAASFIDAVFASKPRGLPSRCAPWCWRCNTVER